MDSVNASNVEPMSTEMLEDIFDGSKSHLSLNRREVRYKIYYHIKRRQTEWKGALLSPQNMNKGFHIFLKAVVNNILNVLPILGDSGS